MLVLVTFFHANCNLSLLSCEYQVVVFDGTRCGVPLGTAIVLTG